MIPISNPNLNMSIGKVNFVLYELCQLESQMNCLNRIVKTKLNMNYVNLCQYQINEICQKDYVNWIMSP